MKLTIDLSILKKIAKEIGATASAAFLDETIKPLDPIDIKLRNEGIDLNLEDINLIAGKPFDYKGRQVLLYLPKNYHPIDMALKEIDSRNKFHITYCATLQQQKNNGSYDKYIATNKLTGVFEIFGNKNTEIIKINVKLNVCQNCLKALNYKNAVTSKQVRLKVRDEFNITEFFASCRAFFPHMPSGIASDPTKDNYSQDWEKISQEYRESQNYCCENCNLDLSANKNLLHTHHIDHFAGNNNLNNLKALCIACHSKQHNQMGVNGTDMQIITRLRSVQHKY